MCSINVLKYAAVTLLLLATGCNYNEPIVTPPVTTSAFNRIYEYSPAPGQFINENFTASTAGEACKYATERLRSEYFVSLGGFGGYIVAGFDHSITNDGGYNLEIKGNAFGASSEPGIVWVMKDDNGDGLPNDTWHEIKGSEWGKAGYVKDYSVTYFRPEDSKSPVKWQDSEGREGTIERIAGHIQESYYPTWIHEDSYTLQGSRLAPNVVYNQEKGQWIAMPYEWGYADNFGSDRSGDDNPNADAMANHFKISDAVKADGTPAGLESIDFVKIQTGVNVQAPAIGEISTEIIGIADYNMIKQQSYMR